MKKFLTVLLFLSILQIKANTYIVSQTGGDFASINEALAEAQAGDTVMVRAGEPYNEIVVFPRSGNEMSGYITLMAYYGERPVIDGTGLEGNDEFPLGLIKIIDKNYVKVIGFEIKNLKTSDSGKFPAGIWVRGTSHHIELINNIIHNIEQNGSDAGAHGIAVYGTSGTSSIHDITIWANEIYDCKLGWSESLALNGNVENFLVRANTVHDNDNIAFVFIGHEGECPAPELDQARNGTVIANTAYNIDSRGNPAYGNDAGADGFYVDGGKDIIFELNTAYNCNIGFEIASEHGGKSASGIIVRNNLIRENSVVGLSIGGYSADMGAAFDCKIVNNTLYKNNTDNLDWGGEILIQFYCENNEFFNNIVYSKAGFPLIDNATGTDLNNVFDYNLYYTEGVPLWRWEDEEFSNVDDFRIGSGQEATGFFDDPKLTDPSHDLPDLQSSSPAIDVGRNFDPQIVGDVCYLNRPRILNDVIDIGAVEFDMPISVEDDEGNSSPLDFRLLSAYPNPFGKAAGTGSPFVNIRFAVNSERAKDLVLTIFDATGRVVEKIFLDNAKPGRSEFKWNATGYSSGSYFAVLTDGKYSETVKILLLK